MGVELFVLAAVFGAYGFAVVRSLTRDGLSDALRKDRDRAIVELLVLAVLADGELSAEESAAIDAATKKSKSAPSKDDLDTFLGSAHELRDPVVLRARIRKAASTLEPDDRIQVFVQVTNLAHRGSRAFGSNEGGYRDGGATPEALVAIFREALGITSG